MKKHWMKALSFALALVMVVSMAPISFVSANETETEPAGEASTTYEPWGHGYRFVDVINWDPATDPYADELVAEVPLQERNDTYAPTQSNPELTDRAKLYAISSSNYRSTDVNEAPWNAGMAYDEFSYGLFKFWQYCDMTGAGGRPTADVERGASNKEYGTIAIPMAAGTNAAHKNGVLSIAEYFLPRNPQYTEEWLQKDENGNYPYADKLIEIMEYYGFDGYFINQEEAIPEEYVPRLKEVMKYMMDKGAYIQWYDSITNAGTISYQNIFNSTNSDFVYDTTHGYGQVSHSIFLNYWYDADAIKKSAEHAESLGLDPYETVYMGLEGGEWRFGIDLEAFWDIMYDHDSFAGNLMQEDGQPYTSFAIWGSDFYREQYNKADNNRYKVAYQWEADERERMYFTSPSELVGDYDTTDIRREDVGFTYEDASADKGKLGTQTNFKGISRYVVEKSVINGNVFATDFNTGHGLEYRKNGEVVRELEWSNFNLQDILPTWQWWITSDSEVTLDMDYDFGPKYERVQGAFPFTQVGAYNGGNSLVIYGDLSDEQLVNLYKTELNVAETSKLNLTYNHVSETDASVLKVALALQVDDETVEMVYVPVEKANVKADWVTAEVDLAPYAGRTIAAIGLALSAETKVEGYQLNVGRLVVTDGAGYTPAVPENVHMELNLTATGEYQLAWDLASYDEVKNYHVYAVYADGSTRFVGGAYADEYYISKLENAENVVALEVRAVGADGSESDGVKVAVNTGKTVSDIRTVSENNKLNVSWNEEGSFESVEVALTYWYSNKTAPEAVTVAKGAKTASFDIEVEDGAKYVLTVTTVNADGTKNESVNYFGELADHYAEPYEGEARLEADGLYDLTVPVSQDWFKLEINVNGAFATYERFGGSKLQNIAVPAEGIATMIITVTDKDGNVSEPVTKLFYNGTEMPADGTYGEELIPDAALRAALNEQVGTTVADLLNFKGELDLSGTAVADLSGLNLLTGLRGLKISDTPITVLDAANLPTSLTDIGVKNSEYLTEVYLDNRPGTCLTLGYVPALTKISAIGYGDFGIPLNLAGAPELKYLDVTGTAMDRLVIANNTKLEVFLMSDSNLAYLGVEGDEAYPNAYYWVWDNAKLDLTATTAEGKLYLGMKDYFATTSLEERVAEKVTPIFFDGGSYASGGDLEVVVEVDNGWTHELTSVSFTNQYNAVNPTNYFHRYNVLTATVHVSDDGKTWKKVATYEDGLNWTLETVADYNTVTIELPAGTRGKYVKLVAPDLNDGTNFFDPNYGEGTTPLRNGYPYISGLTVNGNFIDYTGFTYAGQQPAVVRETINNLTVADDGAEHQTLDLLDAHYASARTVSSRTLLRDIEGAEWLDADYVRAEAYRPAGVRVAIEGPDGTPYVHPADSLGQVLPEKVEVNLDTVVAHAQNNNEEGWRLFDGKTSTKWCGGDGGAMWLAFELKNGPAVLSDYFTVHAGSESNDFITYAYRVQYLNTDKVSEADYLAMDEAGKKAVAADPSNWIDLSVVTGNSANEVATEIPMETLAYAQVYRFQVDASGQPGKQTWGALRIYEMELYAFEGNLDNVTNGLLKAEVPGNYHVVYNVAGQPINETVVTVEHDCPSAVYDDIGQDTWYHEAVDYMTVNGLMNGMTPTHFGPELTLNRAQLTTILYRMAGSPEVGELDNPFVDVKEGTWYYDGFVWCYNQGIIVGKSETIFDPAGLVTRAEMVTMLHRYAGKPEANVEVLSGYVDGDTVLPFAHEAFAWAIENEIVNGMGNNDLQPFATANRAQIAVILARYIQK